MYCIKVISIVYMNVYACLCVKKKDNILYIK